MTYWYFRLDIWMSRARQRNTAQDFQIASSSGTRPEVCRQRVTTALRRQPGLLSVFRYCSAAADITAVRGPGLCHADPEQLPNSADGAADGAG
jgi:hypothetical protein